MDSPLVIGVVVLAVAVIGLWYWSARQAGADSGDFVRRLEDRPRDWMTAQPASPGAPGGPPAAREPTFAAAPLPATSGAAITPSPPAGPPVRIDDPVIGPLTFVDLPRFGCEWERESGEAVGIPSWVTIEAGPEGPSDVQRTCYAALRDRHAEILARGVACVRAALVEREMDATLVAPSALFIGPPQPGVGHARGVVYMRVAEGDAGDDGRVWFVSDDDWKTLEAVVEDV